MAFGKLRRKRGFQNPIGGWTETTYDVRLNQWTRIGKKQELSIARRDKSGRFLKGVSGNPGGAPRGRRTALQDLERSVKKYQREHGIPYWEAVGDIAIRLAQEKGNATLLVRVMDKFLPSLEKVEATIERPVVRMDNIMITAPDGTTKPLFFNIGSPDRIPDE